MNREELLKKISTSALSNVNLVFGREAYLIEEIEDKFKSLPVPEMADFNMSIIDGKETDLKSVRSALETLPFMDEKRYVIIKDFELFKGKRKNFSESDEEEMSVILKNIADTTVVLFLYFGDIDKRKSLYRTVSSIGDVYEAGKLSDIALLNWCRDEFERQNVEIKNNDITYFIEMSGYRDRNSDLTLSNLKNEIQKLASYVGRGNPVTKEEINRLQSVRMENDIFLLIDMIGSKNSRRSFKIMSDMLDEGESVLGIFSMLSKQFNNMLQVKSLQERKYSSNQMADALKLHPYVLNKVIKQSRNFDEDTVVNIMNYITESDFRIKQGLVGDRLAAEILIAKYCFK